MERKARQAEVFKPLQSLRSGNRQDTGEGGGQVTSLPLGSVHPYFDVCRRLSWALSPGQ